MYHVVWSKVATDSLAAIWNDGDSALRRKLTRISSDLDQELSADPSACGESRSGGSRLVVFSPLTIYFRIDEAGRRVKVLKIFKHR